MAFKRSWFPPADRVAILSGRNISYLYSLWIGITVPLLNLPAMIIKLIVVPMLHGVFVLFMTILTVFVVGVTGRALGYEEVEEDATQPD